ncbi:MAG: hypothetical protein AAF409_11125 [Pseudomonadota bacterium]
MNDSNPDKSRLLASLRNRIARHTVQVPGYITPKGLSYRRGEGAALRLALGHVHEVQGDRPGHGAAIGFAARCLAAAQEARTGPVLWAATPRDRIEDGRLYLPGLVQADLDPARLLIATPQRQKDLLWVLEEALSSGALSGVAAWVGDLALTPSRRLALAAARHGTPLVLLRHWQAIGATAAETRWRITPRPSQPHPFDAQAPGRAVWNVTLERARSGPPRTWEVVVNGAEDALDLVAGLRDGPLAARLASPGADRLPPEARAG